MFAKIKTNIRSLMLLGKIEGAGDIVRTSQNITTVQDDYAQDGRDVAVKCWFRANGKPTPLMFKIMENDDVVTVNNIEVLNAESQKEFGTVIWRFRCRAPIHQRLVYFFLIFHSKAGKWKIFI